MIHRYRGGIVPAPEALAEPADHERELGLKIDALIESVKSAVASFQFSFALREIWEVIGATNRYIVTREPWVLAKDAARRSELDTALHVAGDTVRVIAELVRPFMPATGERTLRMLGIEPSAAAWQSLRRGTLKPGTVMGPTTALFPRMEQSLEELQNMAADNEPTPPAAPPVPQASPDSTAATTAPVPPAQAGASTAPAGERISIEDFMKVELRVAKVLTAERSKSPRSC
jgi:methionyl-tRNA synthetase